jgi:hypothetical protein
MSSPAGAATLAAGCGLPDTGHVDVVVVIVVLLVLLDGVFCCWGYGIVSEK